MPAILFGWGSHGPTEMYNLYSSKMAGVEYFNAGYYSDKTVDANLDAALGAVDQNVATQHWKAAQLDSAGVGFTASRRCPGPGWSTSSTPTTSTTA